MPHDDLFVIECHKEVPWPYGHRTETERLVQDSAGRLFRLVATTNDSPFACAHECLAEHFGAAVGLDTPPGEQIRFDHQDAYAQRFDGEWLPFDETGFEARSDAAQTAASILAFDFWLGNIGRHEGTIVFDSTQFEDGESAGHGYSSQDSNHDHDADRGILLIRHQHCFIGLYDEDDEMDAFEPIPPETSQIAGGHPMAKFIANQYDFDPFLRRLESLEPQVLRDVIRLVPPRWLSPGQKAGVYEYLSRRAQRLRGMLNELRPFCPNWSVPATN